MKWIGKHNIFDDLMIGGVLLTPPDPTYEYELTLPNNDGSTGQVLTTDGNGLLTWTTAAGSGVTMTNGANNRVMTATGTAAITGETDFTFDDSIKKLFVGAIHMRGPGGNNVFSYNGATFASYLEMPSAEALSDGSVGSVIKVTDGSGSVEAADLLIEGGNAAGTNMRGGIMRFNLGTHTGSGTPGSFLFKGSGATEIAKIYDTGLRLPIADQAIVFEGGSHDTTFKAQTTAGAARTITLPDATGTVALTSDIPALSVPVTIGQGGTGQTTQQAAIDALTAVSGASTSDVLRKDGSGNATWAALPSNVTLNGTTSNGIPTYASANTLDIESTLIYSPNTLSIGDTTASDINIITPPNGPGVAGSEWLFTNGNSGGGTDIRPGAMTFNSGMGTGSTTAGMYVFAGGPMNNPSGGTGYSTSRSMVTIQGDNGAVNSTILKMDDLNSTRDYFDITVTVDAKTTLRNVKGSIGGGSPDMIIDSQGKLELNADAGTITFADGTDPLAKIDTNGISFKDNTGAGVVFEGATDNANQTTLSVIDPTGTRAVNLPDASGTVALTQSTARLMVSLRTDDAYVMYLGSVNRWYHANRVFSSIGTQSTLDGASVTDSIAITSASYIATRPCTVHGIVVTWYPSATSDVEFEILKVPLVDDSILNVTFSKMTHTDHNGSYTANRNYVKAFAVTGGNTLVAGEGLALAARRTSGSNTYMNGGQIYAEIEITG